MDPVQFRGSGFLISPHPFGLTFTARQRNFRSSQIAMAGRDRNISMEKMDLATCRGDHHRVLNADGAKG